MKSILTLGRAPLLVVFMVGTSLVMGAEDPPGPDRTSSMSLDIGGLAPDDSIVITFEIDIEAFLPFENGVYQLSTRGTVTGDNFDPVPTDDPDTAEPNDPTITIVKDGTTPVVVSDLRAASTDRGVTVSWTLARGHVPLFTDVLIQRASAASGPYVTRTEVPLQPVVDGTFTDPDVQAGATYWYRLVLRRSEAEREFTGSIRVQFTGAPLQTGLDAPLVVPGKPIQIGYSIGSAKSSAVKLEIFDVTGRRIRVLQDGVRSPGRYREIWDRRSQSGRLVAQGLYFVRLQAHGQVLSRKTVVLQ